MKQIYFSAWIVLTIAALVTVLTGSFSPAALVVFSLIALSLVYMFALWSVIVNTRDLKTE